MPPAKPQSPLGPHPNATQQHSMTQPSSNSPQPHPRQPPRPKRTGVDIEEDKVWIGFYEEVRGDAAIAKEIKTLLDDDLAMKQTRQGLYLMCQRKLRLEKERQARNDRIGRFVRRLFTSIFVDFPNALRQATRNGGDIAVACLPELPDDPAQQQVQRLTTQPKYKQAQEAFVQQGASAPVAGQVNDETESHRTA